MTTNNDPLRDTGAYAVNSLSDEERRLFDRAAASDQQLRTEADELSATATLLGLAATPVQPSAGLKANLMAAIAVTPQLPAQEAQATGPAAVQSTVSAETESGEAESGETVSAETVSGEEFSEPATTTGYPPTPAERRATGRWFTRPGTILAAAAAAVVLFLGGGLVGSAISQGGTQPVDQTASALAAINAAPDMRLERTELTGGGAATVMWAGSLGQSAIVVDGLPELPTGSVYEAWYIATDGTAASAGLFSAAGTVSLHVLDGTMTPGDTVGVTVEPAGGSKKPTTDPILVVPTA
jgi:anti-sigma-K factor RskA